MGRRSDHTRAELEVLLLDSAKAILREHGLSELSVRRVATRAGYSVGTIYNVFGSFSELILRINAETLDLMKSELLSVVQSSAGAEHLGMYIGRAYLNFCRLHQPYWELLFEFRFPPGHNHPAWYEEKVSSLFHLLESALTRTMKSTNATDLARAGRVLWAGLHGICVLALSGRLSLTHSEEPELLCDSLFINYLAGFATSREGESRGC